MVPNSQRQLKFVLTIDPFPGNLLVHDNARQPIAWKEGVVPTAVQKQGTLCAPRSEIAWTVLVNKTATVVQPERDTKVGNIGHGASLSFQSRSVAYHIVVDIKKVGWAAGG